MRWDSRLATAAPAGSSGLWLALKRGFRNRGPLCGEGRIFNGYLTVVPECAHCGAPLGRLRADDAPPYFTILLVGHLVVPWVLLVERRWMPPMWLHMAVWLPLFTVLCILVLRPIKGATVGWMARLGFLDDAAPRGS